MFNPILFEEDWAKHPEAIIDFNTTNVAFVRLAKMLSNMGVKNHSFILALYNPKLVGVDPFSKTLSKEQIAMIITELYQNPWYLIREISRAPSIGGGVVRFKPNRSNIATLWLFFQHINVLVIQLRQTGKTFIIATLLRGLLNFWVRSTEISYLTKDNSLRIEVIEKIKAIEKTYPPYLMFTETKHNRNKESIFVASKKNKLNSYVGQLSVPAAMKIARGHVVPINIVDEGPYISNVEHSIPSMLKSGLAAVAEAKRAGTPYGNIFITTAAVVNTPSARYFYKMYQASFKFNEGLYDEQNTECVRAVIAKNSRGSGTVVLDFSFLQLGFTKEWLKDAIINTHSERLDIETDFLSKWPSGGGRSVFTDKEISLLDASEERESRLSISEYGYALNWYIDESVDLTNTPMVLGSDTSEAIGNDDITLVLVSTRTGETLATGIFNETNTLTFSRWIVTLIIKYRKMVLVMERKSTGSAILDNILELLAAMGINAFTRVFNWTVEDQKTKPADYETMLRMPLNTLTHSRFRKTLGFATTGTGRSSRDRIYGEALKHCVANIGHVAKDPTLIKQISGLVMIKGRIDHDIGGHDDVVFAWALTYWFLTMVRNVEDYGLEKREFLLQVRRDRTDAADRFKDIQQERLKKEIIEHIKKLEETRVGVKSEMLIRKIRKLYTKVDLTGNKGASLDEVLANIEIKKKKKLWYR